MNNVKENFQTIEKIIAQECAQWGRKNDAVTLVAVSKEQPEEKIRAALEYGHRIFGENRVQDAKARWTDLKAEYPAIKLHLIGPLQTNKVGDAVALFDVIETVDRIRLVDALLREMEKQKRALECFIQVNTGAEPQKSGVLLKDFEALYRYALQAGLKISGVMCIPPADEAAAPHFALLKKMANANQIQYISMGMSGDYRLAVPLGATHVRIGSALFGMRRDYSF